MTGDPHEADGAFMARMKAKAEQDRDSASHLLSAALGHLADPGDPGPRLALRCTIQATRRVAALRAYLTLRYVHTLGQTPPGINTGYPHDDLREAGDTMESILARLDKAVASLGPGPGGPDCSRGADRLRAARAHLRDETVDTALGVETP